LSDGQEITSVFVAVLATLSDGGMAEYLIVA
jgi:hypothetical protein